jgi:hypothetical protein
MRKLASANESETNRDSRSEERTDDLNDLLIENAFHFREVNMSCHIGATSGGLHGIRKKRACRGVALNQESQFLAFWGLAGFSLRAVADLRTEL